MVYFTCPYCRASLYVPLEWGRMFCPFCGGVIRFADTVILEWKGDEKQDNGPLGRNIKMK